IPLNRLGLGVANPAAIPYVLGDPYREQTLEQIAAGVNLSTTPFATWAGDVSIAVGAEYREEKINGFVPDEFQPVPIRDANGNVTGASNRWSVGNYLASVGRYDVKEAYLETVVPLGLGLEFNGAVRATDYSTAGYVTTWKAGATWQPIDDIRFRVTRSRDIRAPNLNDLFQAGSANSDSVGNPGFVNGESPPFVPAGQPPQAGYSYSGFATGNPNLEAEKADQWNVGVVLSPTFLPGFNLSLDYFDITIEDAISTLGSNNILNACYGLAGYQEDTAVCSLINRAPGGQLWTNNGWIVNTTQNIGGISTSGVDVVANYNMNLDDFGLTGMGGLSFNFTGTWLESLETDVGIGGATYDCVGFYENSCGFGSPEWRHRFTTSWATPWDVNLLLTWRYHGEVEHFGLADTSTRLDRYFDAYNWFDIGATWQVVDNTRVRVGINNVFDKDPPLSYSGNGNGNTYPGVYDSMGRYIFFGITSDF
ncbi:MAG: TonB-dependent receptor domain-containing protein, partial [Brevundimonas sp.]